MDIKTIVHIFDSVNDCNEGVLDSMCTNLVSEFNSKFDIKISFGKNAVKFGAMVKTSLAEVFLFGGCCQFGDDGLS